MRPREQKVNPQHVVPADETLRHAFKHFNIFMVGMWRLGLGRWINALPGVTGRIMVLMHTGRKSGRVYQTPVNFALVDGEVYCTAGFGPESDWYRNLQANPQVEIWLPGGRWQGLAEDVSGDARRQELLHQVMRASGWVAPLMGIDLRKISAAEFEKLTGEYRLLRIRRIAQLQGPGGPGDLTWIWLPVLLGTALVLFSHRKRR